MTNTVVPLTKEDLNSFATKADLHQIVTEIVERNNEQLLIGIQHIIDEFNKKLRNRIKPLLP